MSRALVTGASRGIGKAIAAALRDAGYEVVATARKPEALAPQDRIPGITYHALDLSDAGSIESLVRAAGPVDVLVSNAGQSQIGAVEELPVADVKRLFEANLFGALRLIQLFLPGMRQRRSGKVIAIASMAAVSPVPFLSSYSASKAALVALMRGLRYEVAPFGITVAVVAPFDIHTTIPLDIRYDPRSAYLPDIATVHEKRDKALAEAPGAELVGAEVISILRARRPGFFHPVGREAAMNAFLLRHLPAGAVERIIRRLFGLTRGAASP